MPPLGSHTFQSVTMTVDTDGYLSRRQREPSSPRRSTFDFLSSQTAAFAVQSDHDYVLKAKVVEEEEVEEESQTMLEPFTTAADTLLSSSADMDLETMLNDIDFTNDLADLNLSLGDLGANDDFPMEESFQDFIDSALDKSFNPQQWELEESRARERAAKEDFMRALGLQPSSDPSDDTPTRPELSEAAPAPWAGLGPLSPDVSPASVPTKQCRCSEHSNGARAMYTTAGLKSPNVLSPSTPHFSIPAFSPASSDYTHSSSPVGPRVSHVVGPCLNCIQNRDVLKEFSKPLTIDVSMGHNDPVIPYLEQNFFNNERLQMTQDAAEEEELLQWLSANHSSSTANNSAPTQPTLQQTPPTHPSSHSQGSITQNLDLDTFMDLEDLLNDATPSSDRLCQHDHTYQKSTRQDSTQDSDTHVETNDLESLSFTHCLQDSLKQLNLIPDHESEDSGFSSPSSSPLSSPYPSSTFHHQDNGLDKNHLDILNFFSDEFSSSLLGAGSPMAQLRFM